jgi:hypothetical protein
MKENFRLVYNETDKTYHIQKKRFWGGWKMLDWNYLQKYKAVVTLNSLREKAIKKRTKKNYVILND